ncbi:mucin-17-like isoform X2 [Gambusia affinis]|uniref:mucin-17-like isoform X2 n=1 Tax=Gambusia affinis TaxID=33528 RepID=UPI001CDBCD8D|nr:mucin-17-like isoform X2 [Gambusia affinis]
MLSSVLLLLLITGAQAAYYGAVITNSFGDIQPFVLTYNFIESGSSCQEVDIWHCGGNCTTPPFYAIDESRNEWCQKTEVRIYTTYGPRTFAYQHSVGSSNWIENRNGIVTPSLKISNDFRNRSDISKPNSTPQTTILPLVRVPSNCQRNINLLLSDPDGDDIRCRYAAGSECNICTPPSVLNVSSSCSLSFSPTNSSNEGSYAVQMVMKDFPRQNVTLTDGDGVQSVKSPSDFFSSLPVQFVFRVDPAAPSCTEGEFLPRFLPPTPEHGAQIYTNFNQAVEIIVRAEATQAEITELLISGPVGVTKSSSGSGNFTLTWRPLDSDRGLKKTLCFVVQANSSGSVYQSDLRCVFVTAGETPTTVSPLTTAATPFTPNMITTPLFTTTPPPTTTATTTNQPTTTTTENQTAVQTTAATTPTATTTTTTTTPNTTITTTTAPTTTTTPIPTVASTNQTTLQTIVTPPPTTTTPSTLASTKANVTTSAPGPQYIIALNMKISTTLSMKDNSDYILALIKSKLIEKGLPSDISLRLLSSGLVAVTSSP